MSQAQNNFSCGAHGEEKGGLLVPHHVVSLLDPTHGVYNRFESLYILTGLITLPFGEALQVLSVQMILCLPLTG